MPTELAIQIKTRMKAKNLTLSEIERGAGLKTHAVQNILRGKSKRPSAINLQAVANVLGCTVEDLLETPDALKGLDLFKSDNDILEDDYKYENSILMIEVLKEINKILETKNKEITVEKFLIYFKESYMRSLQKDPTKVNVKYAEWFVDLI